MRFLSTNHWVVLIVISCGGLLLRSLRLGRRGLIRWDEAAYYREAIVVRDSFRFLFRRWRELRRLRRNPDPAARARIVQDYEDSMIYHYVYFKPWLSFISLPAAFARGRRDMIMILPNVLLGTTAIAAVYVAGDMLFGPEAGLIAAALLAVSGLHVWHSRSSSAEIGVSLCWLIAFSCALFHARGVGRAGWEYFFSAEGLLLAAAAGFFVAGTVMFNPMWMVMFPPLFAVNEVFLALVTPGFGPPHAAASLGVMAVAGVMCILITDAPFIALSRLLPESNTTPHVVQLYKFIEHIVRNLRARLNPDTDLGVTLPRWYRYTFYPSLLLKTEGLMFCIVSAFGIGTVWGAYPGTGGAPALHAVFMLGLLTFTPQKASRGNVILIAPLVLCAAGVLTLLPPWVLFAALLVLLARGGGYAVRLSRFSSGVMQAADYVRARGGRFLSASRPFVTLYGDHYADGDPIPGFYTFKELLELYESKNYRFLIVDYIINFPNLYHDRTIEVIESNLSPVFRCEDPNVTYIPLQTENEYHHPNLNDPREVSYVARWNMFVHEPAHEDRFVRVYDLDHLFNPRNDAAAAARDTLLATAHMADGGYKAALDLLRKAQRNGDTALVKFYTGVCHRNMDRNSWALRALSESADTGALPRDLLAECRALILTIEAEEAMNAGDFSAAEQSFRELLILNPFNAALKYHLAVCLMKLGRERDAERQLESVLKDCDVSESLRAGCEQIMNQLRGDNINP